MESLWRRWSVLRLWRTLTLGKTVRAVATATLTAVATFEVVLTREDHEPVLEVIVDAFLERLRHQLSSDVAIFSAASSPVTNAPSLNETYLPETAGTRSPGTMMPTKFNGSAAETAINSSVGGALRNARSESTAIGNANCSPRKPETKRPPRTSPLSSSRLNVTSNSRHFGRIDSRASNSRKTTP